MTWSVSSIPTWQWPLTTVTYYWHHRSSLAVYISCEASTVRFQLHFFQPPVVAQVVSRLADFQPASSSVFNWCSLLLYDLFAILDAENTSLIRSLTFAGLSSPSGSRWSRYTITDVLSPPPQCMSSYFANVPAGQRLEFTAAGQLTLPSFRLFAVSRRAFPVAGAHTWNQLKAVV